MEHAAQVFAALSFLVIGLSHLVRPMAWVTFFQALAARGVPGAFAEGFLLLNFGAWIVALHNVWHGPAVVLTLVGWAQPLKALIRFVAPQVALRIYSNMTPERAWTFRIAGVFALAFSGFCGWLAIAAR